MATSFKQRLQQGKPLVGTLLTVDSCEVAELLTLCGFEWLFIDMEHSPLLDPRSVQHVVQAIQGRAYAVVRVPENSDVWIKRSLDSGCDGIIVPHVNNASDASRAVAAAKYPPQGHRSVGIARAHGYGASFGSYIKSANDEIAVVAQIEHVDAVTNMSDIAAIEGIDAAFVGPYDLSGSLGVLGDVKSNSVQDMIGQVREICIDRKLPYGIFTAAVDQALTEIKLGCTLMAVSSDLGHLFKSARKAVDDLTQAV